MNHIWTLLLIIYFILTSFLDLLAFFVRFRELLSNIYFIWTSSLTLLAKMALFVRLLECLGNYHQYYFNLISLIITNLLLLILCLIIQFFRVVIHFHVKVRPIKCHIELSFRSQTYSANHILNLINTFQLIFLVLNQPFQSLSELVNLLVLSSQKYSHYYQYHYIPRFIIILIVFKQTPNLFLILSVLVVHLFNDQFSYISFITQPCFSNQNLKPLNLCLLLLLLNYQSFFQYYYCHNYYQSFSQYYYCHNHCLFYSQHSTHLNICYYLNQFSIILFVILCLQNLSLFFVRVFRDIDYCQTFHLLFYLHIPGHWAHLLSCVCFMTQLEITNNLFRFYIFCQIITKFKMINTFQIQYVTILSYNTYLPYYNSLRHFVKKSRSYRNDPFLPSLVKYSKLISKYY